jgi:hypothetical protein
VSSRSCEFRFSRQVNKGEVARRNCGCRSSDREIEEPLTLFGPRERRSWRRAIVLRGVRLRQSGIRAGISLFSVAERERDSSCHPEEKDSHLIPEDREVRRRGRPAGNPEMERQMRDLRARLEEMETTQRRGVGAGDLSDSEVEEEAGHEEEVTAEDASTERLIKAIARMGAKAKMDIPVYEGIWMQKSCWIGSELLTHTSIMKMWKKIRKSSMQLRA